LQQLGTSIAADFNQLPFPLRNQVVSPFSAFHGDRNGDDIVLNFVFVSKGGQQQLPLISNTARIMDAGAGHLGLESMSSFSALAIDHRYHLLYWRLRPGAAAPANRDWAAFYSGLLDLQAGQMPDAYARFVEASRSNSKIVAREA